jgi:3-hydroxyisobutyrate dehydrogenase-like beta-hydroxyacid dehydrogenase
MKVGFIGLGNMGSGMAASLLKAGNEVAVYNRTPAKAQALVDQGARLAQKIADACHGDAVFTMLADDTALEAVVFGDQGVLASLSKNAIHISASTISVALADKLSSAHAARGQRFVSAPVFGRPEAAAAAKLRRMPSRPAHPCSTPSARKLFVSATNLPPRTSSSSAEIS